MVEDGGLGSACSWAVVMTGDGVEELRQRRRIEILRALFDHPQAEVNVPEQAAFLGLAERRSASELPHATEIVKQRGCEKKIGAQARMELGGLTAESRYSHGVLEKTSGVAVVPVDACGGKAS